MKFKMLMMLGLVASLEACGNSKVPSGPPIERTQESTSPGGIDVGNPDSHSKAEMSLYSLPGYHFVVKYPKALRLTVESDREFKIDNATIVSFVEDVSEIKFRVLKKEDLGNLEVKTEAALKNYLTKLLPDPNLNSIKLPGASGFYREVWNGNRLQAEYFILTTNADLILIKVDASKVEGGTEFVAPIVNSFVYDVTPPVIYDFKFDPPVLTAGEPAHLLVHATDDFSGIRSMTFNLKDSRGHGLSGGSVRPEDALLSFRVLGNDWYSIDFEINKFQLPQDYSLTELSVYDNASNHRTLLHPDQRNEFYLKILFREQNASSAIRNNNEFYFADDQKSPVQVSQLRPLKITVVNHSKMDIPPPVIHAIRIEPETVNAGEDVKVFVNATDDLSGIDLRRIEIPYFHSERFVTLIGEEKFILEGNNWYSSKVHVSEYLPPGDYIYTGLVVGNKLGKYVELGLPRCDFPLGPFYSFDPYEKKPTLSQFPILKLHVLNKKEGDNEAPIILELKIDPPELVAAQSARLLIRAKDNLSGIDLDNSWAAIRFNRLPERSSSWDIRAKRGPLKSIGDDWYAQDLEVSPYLQSGEYILGDLSVKDKIGNYESLSESFPYGEDLYKKTTVEGGELSFGQTDIPILKVKVKR